MLIKIQGLSQDDFDHSFLKSVPCELLKFMEVHYLREALITQYLWRI